MDLDKLRQQFNGTMFGKMVLHHHRNLNFQTTVAALRGTAAELPSSAQPLLESWLDEIAVNGKDGGFWRRDCGDVFQEICEKGRRKLMEAGIDATDDDVFNMFQVILINFVYGFHQHPQSKAFVQKAIGIGFLRRLLDGGK